MLDPATGDDQRQEEGEVERRGECQRRRIGDDCGDALRLSQGFRQRDGGAECGALADGNGAIGEQRHRKPDRLRQDDRQQRARATEAQCAGRIPLPARQRHDRGPEDLGAEGREHHAERQHGGDERRQREAEIRQTEIDEDDDHVLRQRPQHVDIGHDDRIDDPQVGATQQRQREPGEQAEHDDQQRHHDRHPEARQHIRKRLRDHFRIEVVFENTVHDLPPAGSAPPIRFVIGLFAPVVHLHAYLHFGTCAVGSKPLKPGGP